MLNFRRSLSFAAVAVVVGALALSPGQRVAAQTPSNPAPYNIDLGALITNSLRTAGTVTSAAQSNTNWRGVLCKLVETVSSGSPSTSFKIQAYDAASATYSDIATSSAVTGTNSTTGATILIYPGAAMTTTPTGWVLNAVPLPRTWRISQTIDSGAGASSPATTSRIGCNYLL